MTISEKKMQIVIDNYFKSECDVNTSIRQAFEKGFRIGVKKGQSAEPQFKKGKWNQIISIPNDMFGRYYCSECGKEGNPFWYFCPNCGADMKGEKYETD